MTIAARSASLIVSYLAMAKQDDVVRSSRLNSDNFRKITELRNKVNQTGSNPGQFFSLDDFLQAVQEAASKEKKMFFFKPLPGIDYRPPKLTRGADWVIRYYVKDPNTGQLRRIRIKVNHIKPERERVRVAREIMAAITERLALGWNPLRDAAAPRSTVSVFEAYDAFLAVKRKEAEGQSVASYRSFINVFSDWLKKNGFAQPRPVACVSRETAVAFMDHLDSRDDVSPRTWNNYLSFLLTLHTWLIEHGYIAVNPFEGIRRKPRRLLAKKRRLLTADELGRLLEYLRAENPEYLAVCLLCYCCFIRPKEIALLRCGDVNLDRQLVFVSGEVAKNDRDSVRTIPDAAMPDLRRLNLSRPDWFLFGRNAGRGDDFRPGAQGVNQRKFEAFWSAHVRPALGFPEEVQLYSLKDTGITNMASAGIPINLVRQQADHSNVAITSIYLGLRRAEAVPELRGAQILPK